jgi:hypothetical protein
MPPSAAIAAVNDKDNTPTAQPIAVFPTQNRLGFLDRHELLTVLPSASQQIDELRLRRNKNTISAEIPSRRVDPPQRTRRRVCRVRHTVS